ncbi:MAG: hypothetical protein ABSA90_06295 [Xanthobacteraceae bacterium]|jgi:hypothetical protein
MTTSQPNIFLSEVVSGELIPPEKLGYFRGRLSNRFHEIVLDLFDELERAGKITRAALARRIGKAPEQVTRWLGAPGNWTLDTVSDLFLGMGYEPALAATDLAQQALTEIVDVSFDELPYETNPSIVPAPGLVSVDPAQSQAGGYYLDLFRGATLPAQSAAMYNFLFFESAQWPASLNVVASNTYFRYLAASGALPADDQESEEETNEWVPFDVIGAESLLGDKNYLHKHKLQGLLQ